MLLCNFALTPPRRQTTIVSGTNHEVVLGPYNAHYPKLEAHLLQSGINPLVNRWDQYAVVWPVPQSHAAVPGDEGTSDRIFSCLLKSER
jgi:hypothetical protein